MPNNPVLSPAAAAPVDRLTLGTAWARPAAHSVDSGAAPAGSGGAAWWYCFADSQE
jgi:hypothetical protein